MKVREWLNSHGEMGKALTREGGGLDYFTTILDAEVIGLPCKSCGGSGECVGCGGRGGMNGTQHVRGYAEDVYADCGLCNGTGTCPDCAEAPVYVIAPEAWEAAKTAVGVELIRVAYQEGEGMKFDVREESLGQRTERIALAVLQVLLPGARVAEEVRRQARVWKGAATDIAILAKQEEE